DEETNLRNGRTTDVANPQPDSHQVVNLSLEPCIDVDVDSRYSCGEVNRKLTIHQRAAEHQIECHEARSREIKLNVLIAGGDSHQQLSTGIVLFCNQFVELWHDKCKHRTTDAVRLGAGILIQLIKSVEQFLKDFVKHTVDDALITLI